MFFEDEKDIINENAEIKIADDGTVSWEDVLNSDDDLLIEKPEETRTDKTISLGDDLELVQDNDEDVNNEELISILNEDDMQKKLSSVETNNYNDAVSDNTSEDFDIDSQLANVSLENNNINDETMDVRPRKEEKKSSNITSIIMALLFAGCIAYLAYFAINFFKDQNSKEETMMPQMQQDIINNNQAQKEQNNIEVVQENEATNLKPEENKKEEINKEKKKQIASIVPTGRINPFMPIAKYAQTSIPSTDINYDASGVPKPPEEYGIKEELTEKLMSIAVSGIMYDDIKPSAIITFDNNDYFVQKGDKLDRYNVVDITKTSVTISYGNNTYKANIGEEFKIDNNFYGSAKFIPQNKGGGRQYYSVGDGKRSGYVSEEEIEIKTR